MRCISETIEAGVRKQTPIEVGVSRPVNSVLSGLDRLWY